MCHWQIIEHESVSFLLTRSDLSLDTDQGYEPVVQYHWLRVANIEPNPEEVIHHARQHVCKKMDEIDLSASSGDLQTRESFALITRDDREGVNLIS